MKRFASVLMVMVLLISAIFMACSSSEEGTANEGDTVKVDYTGTLDDGTAFDSSVDPSFGHVEPLEFTIGAGDVLPGFENAVIGLSINEATTVHIPAEEAYGPSEVVRDLDQFPPDDQPEVGQTGYFRLENGKTIEVMVTDISESIVTLMNTHPLAGKDLNFEITLVEIVTPTPTSTPTPSSTPTVNATPNSP